MWHKTDTILFNSEIILILNTVSNWNEYFYSYSNSYLCPHAQFSLVAASTQYATLIQCFPVFIALSHVTSWSFGPCCAICLPALGNSSHTPLHTQTNIMPVLPWEQPGDYGEQSGCRTLWLTSYTFMCWTKLPSWAASCELHAKKY